MAKQPKVLLIYTGGTIGMVADAKSGQLKPFNFNNLLDEVPELHKIPATIDTHSFGKPIDSSNMEPKIWLELAALIGKQYNKYDGFVILHGSDTMAFTASALSFLLENLNKPVILTGSQLPIGTIRTDGKENLITAVEIAAADGKKYPIVPEVCVYFEYRLYRGNRTNKFNAEHFRAFQSPNYLLLAEAGIHINFNKEAIRRKSKGALKVYQKLDSSVAILKLFPGITPAVVSAVLNSGCKAIVLETFGSGNATTATWFIDALKNAIKRGVIIVNITQCAQGTVEQGRYETSSAFNKIGVIGGADLTTEAAVAKLMFLLGNVPAGKIKKQLTQDLRGEQTN